MIRRFDMSSGASEAISFNEPDMGQERAAADVSSAMPLQTPQLRLLSVDEAVATPVHGSTTFPYGVRSSSGR